MQGISDSKEAISSLASNQNNTLPLPPVLQNTILHYCDLSDLKTLTELNDDQLGEQAKKYLSLHAKNLFFSPLTALYLKSNLYIEQTHFNEINASYMEEVKKLETSGSEAKAVVIELEKFKQNKVKSKVDKILNHNFWTILNDLYEQHKEFIHNELRKLFSSNPLKLARESIHWLQVACMRPDAEIVFTLIEQGNDAMADYITQLVAVPTTEINLLYWICSHTALLELKQLRLIKIILTSTHAERFLNWSGKDNQTPLQAALSQNNVTVAEYLLEQKAINVHTVNSKGDTPLTTLIASNITVARQYELLEALLAHGVTKTDLLETARRLNKPALLKHCLSNPEFIQELNYLPLLLLFALHNSYHDLLEPLYRWYLPDNHDVPEFNQFFATILNVGYQNAACVRELISKAETFAIQPADIQALLLRLEQNFASWLKTKTSISSMDEYTLYEKVPSNFLYIFSCINYYLQNQLHKLKSRRIGDPTTHSHALYSLATKSQKILKQMRLDYLIYKIVEPNCDPFEDTHGGKRVFLNEKMLRQLHWLLQKKLLPEEGMRKYKRYISPYSLEYKIGPERILILVSPIVNKALLDLKQLTAIQLELKRFCKNPTPFLSTAASPLATPSSSPAATSFADAKKVEPLAEKIPQTVNEIREFIRRTINALAPVFAVRAEAKNTEAELDAVITRYHTNLNSYFLKEAQQLDPQTVPGVTQEILKQTTDAINQLTAIMATRLLAKKKQQTFSRYYETLTMTKDMFNQISTNLTVAQPVSSGIKTNSNRYLFYNASSNPVTPCATSASPIRFHP